MHRQKLLHLALARLLSERLQRTRDGPKRPKNRRTLAENHIFFYFYHTYRAGLRKCRYVLFQLFERVARAVDMGKSMKLVSDWNYNNFLDLDSDLDMVCTITAGMMAMATSVMSIAMVYFMIAPQGSQYNYRREAHNCPTRRRRCRWTRTPFNI